MSQLGWNVSQLFARGGHKAPLNQTTTLDKIKIFINAFTFVNATRSIMSDGKYSTVYQAIELENGSHSQQCTSTGMSVCIPPLLPIPCGPYFSLDWHRQIPIYMGPNTLLIVITCCLLISLLYFSKVIDNLEIIDYVMQ